MLELQELINKLFYKDFISVNNTDYKIINVVYVTDNEVLKAKLLLENINNNNKILIDFGFCLKIYKN